MLYAVRKYTSHRCCNGVIISTLFVAQYCHVHFNWGGVVVLESTCSTPRKPLYTNKDVLLKPIYQRILRICTMALLYYYDQNPFRIFLSCCCCCCRFFFFNLVTPARSKALICTGKRNLEDSGRSSKTASSCQWPFSSFLLASSMLNSTQFYFNHTGTLQSIALLL